jgi:hypothetical protein
MSETLEICGSCVPVFFETILECGTYSLVGMM